MKKLSLTSLIGIVFLLTSCANIPKSEAIVPSNTGTDFPAEISATPEKTIDPDIISTPTQQAMETPLLVSPTPVNTTTSTIPVDAKLKIACLQILNNFPTGTMIDGTLVVRSFENDPESLWNLETGAKIALPENTFLDFHVSPNGKLLAFTEMGSPTSWIHIVTADGQQQHTISQIDDLFGINGWIDNERLIIDRPGEAGHSSVIVDIFSGQEQEFHPTFPEIYLLDVPYKGWGEYAYTASVFDPDLTRVVYPASLTENPTKLNLVTLDFVSNTIIVNLELNSASVIKHAPVWSPNGSEFVVAFPTREDTRNYIPDEELYSISNQGQVTKLTNLAAYFTVGVDIRLYSWSPDGRYIAFWMEPNPLPGIHELHMQLAVLDLTTQQVTLLCIEGDFRDGGFEPVWAPNSQQLIVNSITEQGARLLVVIDVVQEYAVQIANDLILYGWMTAIP